MSFKNDIHENVNKSNQNNDGQNEDNNEIFSRGQEEINFKRTSPTRIRLINDCIESGKKMPELKKLFGQFFHQGEITVLCGDTGVGKSILAIQIAKNISEGSSNGEMIKCESEGGSVLYFDFELGDRQFSKRYPNTKFLNNLYRVDMNPESEEFSFSTDVISNDAKKTGTEIVIIDNISALIMQKTSVDQEVAMNLMKGLKELQVKENLSILVLAHIPKIAPFEPLTINHVGGSKAITNFADSVFFIAKSKKGTEYRYLKQVKTRNEKEIDGVVELKLTTENGLFFESIGITSEEEHLQEKNSKELKEKAVRLKTEGKSDSEIAKELGIDRSTVFRWIKR